MPDLRQARLVHHHARRHGGLLHADGIRRVVVVPYFLHHGVHLREDVPGLLEAARTRLPGMSVELGPHLGFDEAIVDLLERRVEQALSNGAA